MSDNFDLLLEAARGGDEKAFRALVEPLDRELHAYAYRTLGGFHDADDALQESRLKAWRALATYEPRASFRAWMYRIVTNTCLDMLKARSRRVMPQDVGPSIAPGPPTTAPRADILWIEPYPDALLPTVPGPDEVARLREGIRLAFVRVLQVLPPRQRAALILHDVLDWKVAEVAAILETTEAAINSALQRARAAIARPREESPALATRQAEAVDRFVQAWESGDFDEFVEMLATDAVMSMPPWEYWLDGKEAIVATMRSSGTWDGEPRPGRYRIVPAPMERSGPGLVSEGAGAIRTGVGFRAIRTGVGFRREPKMHRGRRTSGQTLGARRPQHSRWVEGPPLLSPSERSWQISPSSATSRAPGQTQPGYARAAMRTPRRRSPKVPAGNSTSRSPSTKQHRASRYATRNRRSASSAPMRRRLFLQAMKGRKLRRGSDVFGRSKAEAARTAFLPRMRFPAAQSFARTSSSPASTLSRSRVAHASRVSSKPGATIVLSVIVSGMTPASRKKNLGRRITSARPSSTPHDEAPGQCATESTR